MSIYTLTITKDQAQVLTNLNLGANFGEDNEMATD